MLSPSFQHPDDSTLSLVSSPILHTVLDSNCSVHVTLLVPAARPANLHGTYTTHLFPQSHLLY